ncbi:R3H-associated N-terminal domain-containing protein [Lophiotrema nucula]|uniref:R3H-associated N-terminal domain-containing protein n=1 Tax=Lophiotrema nucula TaxID=690887 RepID=A0A6A5Z599_9PLEO|nr:R3H-associated N-terminal domain-containing protein [Lophiotrema nucula]
MAIHPSAEAPAAPSQTQSIDIEAWTIEAAAAMSAVTISAPAGVIQGASVSIQIPLDDHPETRAAKEGRTPGAKEGVKYYTTYGRKEPIRRDSLKRREALLKGKEGSRRRQRWENDRLLNNPYAEPPSPKDWEIRPTHPVHHVPYYLAPLWDAGLAKRNAERKAATSKAKTATKTVGSKPTDPGIVPKELRDKLKRSRGAKGLLMDLEEEVRKFVEKWEEKEKQAEQEGLPLDEDSSDDEIVFVGRNGQMNDLRSPRTSEEIQREMMLFETPEDDRGGNFGRWLVHHIGIYYGLKTWSVTVGDPARREAYIGLKERKMRTGLGRKSIAQPMPRPLWGMV